MRATMTAAAMATIATVETARSIIPLSSRRLLVRPYNALRTHAPLCVLTLLLIPALCRSARVLRLLTRALTPVAVVAVRVRGLPRLRTCLPMSRCHGI
jgi:hypothetical protein